MTIPEALETLARSPLAQAIAKSNHLVTAGLQVFHVIGFVLLLAALTLIALRLLGLILTRHSIRSIAADALPLLWLGAVMTITSGVLLFLTGPIHYYYNPAFETKMLLLLAALGVQLGLLGPVSRHNQPHPLLARTTALLSLALWFAVSWAGRAIGFV